MSEPVLTLAVPSKGRLMEQARALFEKAGLVIARGGDDRGYRGTIEGQEGVEIAFLSASEIARQLMLGRVHMGITGQDLIHETIGDAEAVIDLAKPLGFGFADVVVAVPQSWIDVGRMLDLEEIAAQFRRAHGRRLRVATKYMNLTRRFFAEKGVAGYRIVESLGATEGTPAAGTADIIVDITSTGSTLKANHLKVLEDGVILESQAVLAATRTAPGGAESSPARDAILAALDAPPSGGDGSNGA